LALLGFACGMGLRVGAKPKCANAGRQRILFFLCGGGVLIFFLRVGLCVAKVRFSVKEQRICQPKKSRPKDLFESVCLVVFESVCCCRVGSLRLLPTGSVHTLCRITKILSFILKIHAGIECAQCYKAFQFLIFHFFNFGIHFYILLISSPY